MNHYGIPVHTLVAAVPPPCPCTWVWAPSISGDPKRPFVLKYPSAACDHSKKMWPGVIR